MLVWHDPEQIKESYIRLQKLGAKEFGMHAFLVSGAMTNKYYPALAEIMFKKGGTAAQGDRCDLQIYQPVRRYWYSL